MTYDVVTEEACATHSVPECATVVKHVPEQVDIFMVMKIASSTAEEAIFIMGGILLLHLDSW